MQAICRVIIAQRDMSGLRDVSVQLNSKVKQKIDETHNLIEGLQKKLTVENIQAIRFEQERRRIET